MTDSTDSVTKRPWAQRLRQWLVPAVILVMAGGIVFLIAGNWNTWASERQAQETDDAYLRADLTPLSTKVAGLVAKVAVSDYQTVKSGDLLVQLRDDDFRAQVQQAEAGVASGEAALINNGRQKDLQDAKIMQADEGSCRRKRISQQGKLELRLRNRRLPMHAAASMQPKRTRTAHYRSAGGRKR